MGLMIYFFDSSRYDEIVETSRKQTVLNTRRLRRMSVGCLMLVQRLVLILYQDLKAVSIGSPVENNSMTQGKQGHPS